MQRSGHQCRAPAPPAQYCPAQVHMVWSQNRHRPDRTVAINARTSQRKGTLVQSTVGAAPMYGLAGWCLMSGQRGIKKFGCGHMHRQCSHNTRPTLFRLEKGRGCRMLRWLCNKLHVVLQQDNIWRTQCNNCRLCCGKITYGGQVVQNVQGQDRM